MMTINCSVKSPALAEFSSKQATASKRAKSKILTLEHYTYTASLYTL